MDEKKRLFRLLRADEIDCRIGSIKESGLSLLLYKDARCDMNILDETFGAMNWQRHHGRENANCIVSIYDVEKNEWIDKEDTGTESKTEREKGLASDSFKRACVNWGIGRELYTAPFIWISKEKCKIEANKCYDRFRVVEIGYNSNGEINHLVITNDTRGVDVFTFPQKARKAAENESDVSDIKRYTERNESSQKAEKKPVEAPDGYYYCEKCGAQIPGATLSNGKTITHNVVAARTIKKYGLQLCPECCRNAKPLADESKAD